MIDHHPLPTFAGRQSAGIQRRYSQSAASRDDLGSSSPVAAASGADAALAAPCAVGVATEAQLRTGLTSTCNTAACGTITLAADITATMGRFEYPGSGNGNLTLNGLGHTLTVCVRNEGWLAT